MSVPRYPADKDSGVAWLGEVPEHWQILELKHLRDEATSITYGMIQDGPHIEAGLPTIRTSDMAGDRLSLETCQRTSAGRNKPYARSKVKAGHAACRSRSRGGQLNLGSPAMPGENTQGLAPHPGRSAGRQPRHRPLAVAVAASRCQPEQQGAAAMRAAEQAS